MKSQDSAANKIMSEIFDENTLIAAAQAGDLHAENTLLSRYAPLAKSIARSFYVIGQDGDDLIQTGMIGLMRAVRSFKPDGEATFKTYATHCIRNNIVDAVRKQNSRPAADVDFYELMLTTEEHEPERLFIEDETSRLLLEAISSVLNEREMSVLKLFLDAMSYAEISQKLGIEKKQVDNTIYSLRKKIKKLLENNI